MSDKFRVTCFSCGKVLAVPLSSVGKTGKCPQCKSPITIERPKRPVKKRPASPKRKSNAERPAPPPIVEATPPRLDVQPTHRAEVKNDRSRISAAVSTDSDKFAVIQPYLMEYERPVAMAIQRQFPFSIFADIVLLSSHRLLVFHRFFTKIQMFDVNYVDFADVTIQQGFFTSSISISTDDHRTCTVSRLVTDQALNLYRQCQDIETKARLARRQFQLEENRSQTTQMHINNIQPSSQGTPTSNAGHLGHRDISQVGDEENNPFRLGE